MVSVYKSRIEEKINKNRKLKNNVLYENQYTQLIPTKHNNSTLLKYGKTNNIIHAFLI